MNVLDNTGLNTQISYIKSYVNSVGAITQGEITDAAIQALWGTVEEETMDTYASLDSPAFVGTPTAPTPIVGDNSTNIATTAFVQDELAVVLDSVADNIDALEDVYVPLDGSIAMTGNLHSEQSEFSIYNSDSTHDNSTAVYGGAGSLTGGYFKAFGSAHTNAGQFMIGACDGTDETTITGTPDGTINITQNPTTSINFGNLSYISSETVTSNTPGRLYIGIKPSSGDFFDQGSRMVFQNYDANNSTIETGGWGIITSRGTNDWSRVYMTPKSGLIYTDGVGTGKITTAGFTAFPAAGTAPYIVLQNPDYVRGDTPSAALTIGALRFYGSNGGYFGYVSSYLTTDGSTQVRLVNYRNQATASTTAAMLETTSANTRSFRPGSDNAILLGLNSFRWKQLVAGTTTISTSDERLKDNIETIPEEVLDAWSDVNWCQFQFKDSIQEKGIENARIHNGLITQRIHTAFANHGLDATRYGFFCYDQWAAQEEERDENGDITTEAREAGDIYSLRYEETLAIEAAWQRRENERLKARVTELEERLANYEGLESRLAAIEKLMLPEETVEENEKPIIEHVASLEPENTEE